MNFIEFYNDLSAVKTRLSNVSISCNELKNNTFNEMLETDLHTEKFEILHKLYSTILSFSKELEELEFELLDINKILFDLKIEMDYFSI